MHVTGSIRVREASVVEWASCVFERRVEEVKAVHVFLGVTVTVVAAPLAGVCALFALVFLWQARALSRIPREARDGSETRQSTFSLVMLSVGNVVLLLVFLWFVALRVVRGLNPDLVIDPQLCPPQSTQGPRYPCDPTGGAVLQQFEVQTMWTVLVFALIWFTISGLVLLARLRAGRQLGHGAASRSE